MMRALVKAEAGPGLSLQQVETPAPGPGEVRIRVEKSAICGTDLHIWNWDAWAAATIPVPMVVGHEYVGRVESLGPGASRFQLGERVTSEGHIVCGACRNCRAGREHLCINTQGVGVNRPGSFAEFLVVPEHNVYPIPEGVPDDVAAILDPYGNAVHTALSFDLVGEDVLITGAGPIGIMAAGVCRRAGARTVIVTDVNDARLALAKTLGAHGVVNIAREDLGAAMRAHGLVEGFDVGLEMSGAPAAFRQMFDVMNNGGKVALLGIPSEQIAIDWNRVIFKGLTLKGIYGREMFDTWYKGLALLRSGLDIAPVVTHRLSIDAYADGFAAMASGEAGKVVLDWR
ncbi:MAG: L-threonine 3-dehydrogenase [Pseudomonadota bacterium]